MSSEHFRDLRIALGTRLSIIGDYNEPSWWSNNEQVTGILTSYVVIARPPWTKRAGDQDVAATVSLDRPLQTVSLKSEKCIVSELVLVLRYLDVAWDDQCTVHVYGVRFGEQLAQETLSMEVWESQTIPLSIAATATVLPSN